MKGFLSRVPVIVIFFFLGITKILAQTPQNSENYNNFKNQIAKGWNTWNYKSMTSHSILPYGLAINLNLRPAVQGNPYDPNYFYDDIMVDKKNKLVRPIAHTFDGSFTHLRIENWKGNTLSIKTAAEGDDVYMLVEPLEKSATKYFVELASGIFWNKPGRLENDGENIVATFQDKTFTIRSTKGNTPAARPYAAPYRSYLADTTFAIYTGQKKTLEEVIALIAKAENAYEKDALKFGDMSEGFKATQSVLGWNTLYDADLNRVVSPVARGWNEAWQGFVLFEWDTYFAALLTGLDNKEFAYSNVFAITKKINCFGAVAFTQQPRSQLADNSQPPVGSMVCWLLYEKYGEKWFLEEIFEQLLSWNRWWVKNRQNRGYITWGASWKGARPQDGAWESGLDNSPMYEDVKMETVGNNSLFNLADVGLNSMYIADCQYLGKIAEALGRKEEAKELKKREKEFSEKLQQLWSEKDGLFLNKYLDSGKFSKRITPTMFYPMIAEVPTKKQAERMLKEHFYNPEEFYGEYIIPSCARNDKSFNNNYWKGAIWGPMNFLVYMGLRNYDEKATEEMAGKSYALFEKAWLDHHYVFENINSEKGVDDPKMQLNTDSFYHWGALMGIMQFMEKGKY